MSQSLVDPLPCMEYLKNALPSLQAVYLFGSQAAGEATDTSDVDVAVLLPVPLAAEHRWRLASELADQLGRDVDLIDLRQASTVLQHQVVVEGIRLWSHDLDSDEFELMVLSEYWDLAIHRQLLIGDIKQRGTVHGG